jgi:hypothetical protein
MTISEQTTLAPPAEEQRARIFTNRNGKASRNLVIVNHPGWQARDDWYEIAAYVARIEPSIAVYVVSAASNDEATFKLIAERPTFVFSAGPQGAFMARRGKVYQGGPIPKFLQLKRLNEAGVRVPRTAGLIPGMTFDPAEWGRFVVVKPTDILTSSHGSGIQLMRTERVKYIAPQDYPEGHPGRRGPMVVQQFIDTGKHISSYRVLTLFGRALYCSHSSADTPRVDLGAPDEVIESSNIAIQTLSAREFRFVYEADVMATAAAAYRAIPEAALQGCDIVRQAGTGTLYVLELNPGGNTWHFSSQFFAEKRARDPEAAYTRRSHLDAFGTAAYVLAERTLAEAV